MRLKCVFGGCTQKLAKGFIPRKKHVFMGNKTGIWNWNDPDVGPFQMAVD